MFDCFGEGAEDVVHVGFGGGLEQAEAEAGAGAGFVESHGHEDVAWFRCSRVAG